MRGADDHFPVLDGGRHFVRATDLGVTHAWGRTTLLIINYFSQIIQSISMPFRKFIPKIQGIAISYRKFIPIKKASQTKVKLYRITSNNENNETRNILDSLLGFVLMPVPVTNTVK